MHALKTLHRDEELWLNSVIRREEGEKPFGREKTKNMFDTHITVRRRGLNLITPVSYISTDLFMGYVHANKTP